MKFTLKIDSDNEAMVATPEYAVAALLRETAGKLEVGFANGVLRDGSNGGSVGSWKLTVSKR
jgi:hypothetical protein